MDRARISVLVVDDHWLIRLGLTSLFASAQPFGRVTDASTAAAAVGAARIEAPDLVVMDIRLPDGSGIDACRQIRAEHPNTRVMVLSSSCEEDGVIAAILAGATGYLLKHAAPGRLLAAAEAVAHGGSVLDATVSDTVVHWMQRVAASGRRAGDQLSEQERKILPLIAQGQTNRQIAANLYLSEHTVKTYVSSLLKKLDLGRRAEAAAYIARQQLARAS